MITISAISLNLSFVASVWLAIFRVVPWWTPLIWFGIMVAYGVLIGILRLVNEGGEA